MNDPMAPWDIGGDEFIENAPIGVIVAVADGLMVRT